MTVLFDIDLIRHLESLRDLRLLVVLRGHSRRRQDLQLARVSSADSATSRLKAPLIAPSDRPTADVAPMAGRLTAVPVLREFARRADRSAPCCPPVRPPIVPLFGNARLVVFPSSGVARPLNPHWMPSPLAEF